MLITKLSKVRSLTLYLTNKAEWNLYKVVELCTEIFDCVVKLLMSYSCKRHIVDRNI
jgi:hypothetical protein